MKFHTRSPESGGLPIQLIILLDVVDRILKAKPLQRGLHLCVFLLNCWDRLLTEKNKTMSLYRNHGKGLCKMSAHDACRCHKIAAGALHINSCESVRYRNDTQSASSSYNTALTLIIAPLLCHIGAIGNKSFPTPTECTRRSLRIKKTTMDV